MIWNAAADYDFLPDFVAFDKNGEADLYFNCIIGSVHRYYDDGLFHDLLLRMGRMPDKVLYQSLFWLGLEDCTFRKTVKERPVLSELRLEYARKIRDNSCSYWDQELFDRLRTAHFAALLGKSSRLGKKEKRLLLALQFSDQMDAREITDAMCHILLTFFHVRLPRLDEKNKSFHLPFRLSKAALHGSLPDGIRETVPPAAGKQSHFRPTLYLPVFHTEPAMGRLRSYLEDCFGMSVYTSGQNQELEQELCTGGHRNCHIHVTNGAFRRESTLKPSLRTRREALARQTERNLQYHRAHLAQHMLHISRLTDALRNALQFDTGDDPVPAKSGRLIPEKAWRAVRLKDPKIFQKSVPCEKGDLSVDILLDASASQMERQERIASQGYIIAESFNRLHIPIRITSYCTVNGCTVLRRYRDYEETQSNEQIFQYHAEGWNRDGLAIRAAGELLRGSEYEHRLLIVLSDCSPNDDHRYYTGQGPFSLPCDYGKKQGILDTAREVRALRRHGVHVLAVCTGRSQNVPAARQIYGADMIRADAPEHFADAIARLICGKIRYL